MAASDYVSLAQHQMARSQRARPTASRDRPARPRKRIHASRPTGMVGSRYPYVGNISDFSWGYWGGPHMDAFGEQYDPEGDDAGGRFGI
jgi:hypothetical protein